MAKLPFSLFKRVKSPYFYVEFYDTDGTLLAQRSSGETTKTRATIWANEQLNKQKIIRKSTMPTLAEFSDGFFAPESEYVLNHKSLGKRISERYCMECTGALTRYILPAFGGMKLNEIDRDKINGFRNDLYKKGYAGATINKALTILKIILDAAEYKDIIPSVPRIQKASGKASKERGILTPDEMQQLFRVEWIDETAKIATLLAAVSGMRLGEVQGLVVSDLVATKQYVTCRRSWDKKMKVLKPTTKNGRPRILGLHIDVIHQLEYLISLNPHPIDPDNYIFFNSKRQNEPINEQIIISAYYDAMAKIGIDESERKRRNIVFHSNRHFLNSLLINAKVPLQKVQAMVGHLTPEMSSHYYHIDDMSDVRDVQAGILPSPQKTK